MTTTTDDRLLKKLDELIKEEGDRSLLLEFYRKLLHVQFKAKKRIGILRTELSRKDIEKRIDQGKPLLSFGDIVTDWSLLREIFINVIAVFTHYPQLFGEIPERLSKAKTGRLLTKKTVRAWFQGTELPDTILADDISENLLRVLIHSTIKPFLENHSQELIDSVDRERWRRNYCPICGGNPDLAFLDKDKGAKWLLCSRCDTEWLFKRLDCPFCATQDHSAVAYFTDDEGMYRLYVCEKCKRYLKTIDLRQAKSEVFLPLERYYTLDLDAQAREQGYH
ncbi:formate dehydrogenase accessory protein FdhE [Chloroflexota bacterium]